MWYLQNQPSGYYVANFDNSANLVRYSTRDRAVSFNTYAGAVAFLELIHESAPHATFYLRPVLVPVPALALA